MGIFQLSGRGDCAALMQILLLLDLYVFAWLSSGNSFKNRINSFPPKHQNYCDRLIFKGKLQTQRCLNASLCFCAYYSCQCCKTHSRQFRFDAILSFLSFICSERWTVEEMSWTKVREVEVIYHLKKKKRIGFFLH